MYTDGLIDSKSAGGPWSFPGRREYEFAFQQFWEF